MQELCLRSCGFSTGAFALFAATGAVALLEGLDLAHTEGEEGEDGGEADKNDDEVLQHGVARPFAWEAGLCARQRLSLPQVGDEV